MHWSVMRGAFIFNGSIGAGVVMTIPTRAPACSFTAVRIAMVAVAALPFLGRSVGQVPVEHPGVAAGGDLLRYRAAAGDLQPLLRGPMALREVAARLGGALYTDAGLTAHA